MTNPPEKPTRNLRDGIIAIEAFIRATAFGGNRERPYVGQRWTWTGERGKQQVPALRYRDLGDTIVEALTDFPGLDTVDLDAVAQRILKQLEDEHGGWEGSPERKGAGDGG